MTKFLSIFLARVKLALRSFPLLFLVVTGGLYLSDFIKVKPLPEPDTPRARFIVQEVKLLSARIGLPSTPLVFLGQNTHSVHSLWLPNYIAVDRTMLDPSQYGDNEIIFVLGHELAHINNRDGIRLRWQPDAAWSYRREYLADETGAALAGCAAMAQTISRHYDTFNDGAKDPSDPHPSPEDRLQHSCPGAKLSPASAMPATDATRRGFPIEPKC